MQDIIQLPVFSDRARLVFNNQALRLRKIYVIFIAIVLTIPGGIASSLRRGRIDNCEQIRIPVCQGMPYNMTRMPNLMHHSTQENARLAIGVYDGLLRQNCSEDLLFFLCSMFAPICTPHFQKEAIPPCRAVCERAKKGCEPVMNRYNFSWPTTLDCDSLPEYDKGVCVEPDAIVSSMPEDRHDFHRPDKKQSDCKCTDKNINKPTKKRYKQGKYSFAIAAKVINIRTLDEQHSFIQVTVTKVLKRGKLRIHERRDTNLWVKSNCVCPKLKKNREYLITGYEDVTLDRLMYTPTSLISRWNRRMESKVKSWIKKKRKKNSKRRCKKRKGKKVCKKRNTGRKLRCRVEMAGETASRVTCSQPQTAQNKQNPSSSSRERTSETKSSKQKKTKQSQSTEEKTANS